MTSNSEHIAATSFPLSRGQAGLWFIERTSGATDYNHIFRLIRFDAALDCGALKAALQAFAQRHPMLRSTLEEGDGAPTWRIHSTLGIDFSSAPLAAEEPLAARVELDARRPFDLHAGPLSRFRHYVRSEREQYLLLVLHHLAWDGWSMGLLLRDLPALYADAVAGRPLLTAPGPSFSEIVACEVGELSGPRADALASYWAHRLEGAETGLHLPLDKRRPAAPRFLGAAHSFRLGRELSARLRQRCGAAEVRPAVALLATFQALLARYSGQDDLSVGMVTSRRRRREWRETVGYLVNMLPIRAQIRSDMRGTELWSQASEAVASAVEHEDYPLPMMVERFAKHGRRSLFQAHHVHHSFGELGTDPAALLMNWDHPLQTAPAAPARVIACALRQSQADLELLTSHLGDEYVGCLNYDADLFLPETVQRLALHFRALLEALVDDPSRRVMDAPLLDEAERARLAHWAGTAPPMEEVACVHSLFERAVEKAPQAVALQRGEVHVSYAQLNARANRVARRLRASGVAPDDVVGLHAERSVEMVVGLLGILKSGAAYLPLDPSYPAERLALMIDEAQPPLVLTQRSLCGALRGGSARVLCFEDLADDLAESGDSNLVNVADPQHLAYVMYTSGSTGRPKGVMVSHAAVFNRLSWGQSEHPLTEQDCFAQMASLSFDPSVLEILWPLVAGARLALAPPRVLLDPAALFAFLQQEEVTALDTVPTVLALLADQPGFDQLTSLRRITCGGEVLSAELRDRITSLLPAILENAYGPTETCIDVLHWTCEPDDRRRTVPLGRPIAGVRTYVLGPRCELLPIGARGELCIGGVQVARGYLRRPDLTAERFLPDPYSPVPGARLYRTGDAARYAADGTIEYLGRLDEQSKIHGQRVEPTEIEGVLRTASGVRDAVVTVVGEPPQQRLVAYVVAPSAEGTAQSLRAFAREHLPDFMVPAAFVVLPALPLMPNGKVDRKALPEPRWQSAIESYVAPRDELEKSLVAIWSEVLRVPRVGIDDDFFELGGDSLMTIQVGARARQSGLSITAPALLRSHSVRELAAAVRESRAVGTHAVSGSDPARPSSYRLAPFQEEMLAQIRRDPTTAAYRTQLAWTIKGDLDPSTLERSYEHVVQRHEALRWCVDERPGGNALVLGNPPFRLRRLDWSDRSRSEQRAALLRLLNEDFQRPFNLAEIPLLRGTLVRLGPSESYLIFDRHQMCADGWSFDLIQTEAARAYDQIRSGVAPLLASPTPYAAYSDWLRAQDAASAEKFWRGQLKDARPAGTLGNGRGQETTDAAEPQHVARIEFGIDDQIGLSADGTGAVRTLARKARATVSTVIEVAWALVLAGRAATDEALFGIATSGRLASFPGSDSVVGVLVNVLPVRIALRERETVEQLVRRVHREHLASREHEVSGWSDIRRWAGLDSKVENLGSVLNFVNIPVRAKQWPSGITATLEHVIDEWRYPLTIDIVTDQAVRFDAGFQRAAVSSRECRQLLTDLNACLEQLPRLEDQPAARIPERFRTS